MGRVHGERKLKIPARNAAGTNISRLPWPLGIAASALGSLKLSTAIRATSSANPRLISSAGIGNARSATASATGCGEILVSGVDMRTLQRAPALYEPVCPFAVLYTVRCHGILKTR